MGADHRPGGRPDHAAAGAPAPQLDAQKKSPRATGRDAVRRETWRAEVAARDPARFVFLGECGTHLAHARAYGRAPRGERAVGRVPRNRGKATTLLASVTADGIGPTATRLGGTTQEAFLAYPTEALAPTLHPGQVVILDNLGAHRPAGVRPLVEARGARLLYLPADSPDFNPIALVFGAPKAALRRVGARTREALGAAIAEALAAITPDRIRASFARFGYPLQGHALRQT